MKYASFIKRFVAIIIDAVIIGIPLNFILSALGLQPDLSGAGAFNPLGPAIPLVVYWLYFALQESSSYQATIGKRAMGLKVTDMHGERINFIIATGRHFSKIISAIILMIGYIMAAFTSKKQALHDIIAGTLVLDTK